MSIISLNNISLCFGGPPLLDDVSLQIEEGERACLVGRNGEGKTSLLKMLLGELNPDSGRIISRKGLKIAGLAQDVHSDMDDPVYDVVANGLLKTGKLLSEYHHVSAQLSIHGGNDLLNRLDAIQHSLEAEGGWNISQQIEKILTLMNLHPDKKFNTLSAGLKRRVLLARALVLEPDVLLLDEPTNHLDIEAITWLEEYLAGFPGTIFFVTHDRMLIRKLATRIIELDRGKLVSWDCDYNTYLKRRQDMLENEAEQQSRFDKKLAKEETWIRQGIKARRTRNEGRVHALMKMREEHKARRAALGKVRMETQEALRTGKLVLEAENISYVYKNEPVFKNFSTTVIRNDRIGIIGPNGCGKTTLLQNLTGHMSPQEGTIRFGTNLQIAYFDQLRSQLNENKTVQENISEDTDTIIFNGRPRHVIGYLQDFLFSPERSRSPVKILSGGERNRLLMARLFTQPSNVLVLDEPTNDLDIETLELLEELLLEYKGTILLVSHDRDFLNNVVASTFVFEGNGQISEYIGGYDDWARTKKSENEAKPKTVNPQTVKKRERSDRPQKMSYKELKELESLPEIIEALEEEQKQLFHKLSDPLFYQKEKHAIPEASARLEQVKQELAKTYERWETLEELQKQSSQ